MIKTVLFDFDGVLVESVDIKTDAFTEMFAGEGKESIERIVRYHLENGGVSRFEKFRFIYNHILERQLDWLTLDRLCERFSTIVVNKVVQAPFVSGALDFLDGYNTKYSCFIVSATPEEELKEIVRRRNMSDYFKEIHGSPTRKDAAINSIIERYHLKNDQIVFVGDALNDYEAARSTDVNFVARIAEGKDRRSLFDGIDCAKVNDLLKLDNVLEECF